MAVGQDGDNTRAINEVQEILRRYAVENANSAESTNQLVGELRTERRENKGKKKELTEEEQRKNSESYAGNFFQKQKQKLVGQIEATLSGLPIIGNVISDLWETASEVNATIEANRQTDEQQRAAALADMNEQAIRNAEMNGTNIEEELRILEKRADYLKAEEILHDKILKETETAELERLNLKQKEVQEALKLLDARDEIESAAGAAERRTGVRPQPSDAQAAVLQKVSILDTADLLPITGAADAAPVRVIVENDVTTISKDLERVSDDITNLNDTVADAASTEESGADRINDTIERLGEEAQAEIDAMTAAALERLNAAEEANEDLIRAIGDEGEINREHADEIADVQREETEERASDQLKATLMGPILAMLPMLIPIGIIALKIVALIALVSMAIKYWPEIKAGLIELKDYFFSGKARDDLINAVSRGGEAIVNWFKEFLDDPGAMINKLLNSLWEILMRIGAYFGIDYAEAEVARIDAERAAEQQKPVEPPPEPVPQEPAVDMSVQAERARKEAQQAKEAADQKARQQQATPSVVSSNTNTTTNVSMPSAATNNSHKQPRAYRGAYSMG